MIKKISIISVLIVVLSFFVYCAFGAGEADEVLAEEADVIKVIKVTESNRDEVFATKLSSGTAETYDPSTRKWNGIPHIERTAKGRLWVTWFSGGPNEPDDDNYVILAYSDDNGETWNDPFIIIDVADTSVRAFDPFLFTRKNGELIVYFYSNGGRWEMTVKNPDATPADIVCGKPKLTEQDLKACIQEPVRLKNGEVMALSQPGINSKQLDAMVSLDDGLSWKLRSTMYSVSANKGISEAKVVELN
ncbi:MAG: exo-alpha-sialidase, partial [Clostridia bacterium]|nr:exo-alpha-sialidase [Clostridia bacterium]